MGIKTSNPDTTKKVKKKKSFQGKNPVMKGIIWIWKKKKKLTKEKEGKEFLAPKLEKKKSVYSIICP